MLSTLSFLKNVALSGTASIVIPVSGSVTDLHAAISANYAAVAGTTGIQAAFQVSADGGSTYTNSNVSTVTVPGVAGVTETVEVKFGIMDYSMRKDALPITHVKINLTNEDGTNACAVAVLTDFENN